MSTTLVSFDKSCGTFGEGKKNLVLSMTLGQLVYQISKYNLKLIINNDHGVDVNMIIII